MHTYIHTYIHIHKSVFLFVFVCFKLILGEIVFKSPYEEWTKPRALLRRWTSPPPPSSRPLAIWMVLLGRHGECSLPTENKSR